jgi:hypothetical protein
VPGVSGGSHAEQDTGAGVPMTPPPQPEYIRQEVMDFAKAMEDVLRKNDYKSHWLNCTYGYLLAGAQRELKEALDADDDPQNYDRVAEELIDVANFCMMYWDLNHPRDRSRPYQSERDKVLDDAEELAEHYYKAYLDGDPYLEKKDFKKMIAELRQQAGEQ